MYQGHSQESRRTQKKRTRKKKALLKDFKLVWYLFVVLAGPAGVVLCILGKLINNDFLFLLGFGGMLVEAVAAVIIVVAARVVRIQRHVRKHARKMEASDEGVSELDRTE